MCLVAACNLTFHHYNSVLLIAISCCVGLIFIRFGPECFLFCAYIRGFWLKPFTMWITARWNLRNYLNSGWSVCPSHFIEHEKIGRKNDFEKALFWATTVALGSKSQRRMTHDACGWCMIHDAWCIMHDAWCMMQYASCIFHPISIIHPWLLGTGTCTSVDSQPPVNNKY